MIWFACVCVFLTNISWAGIMFGLCKRLQARGFGVPLPFSFGTQYVMDFVVGVCESRLKDVDVPTVGISFSVNL